MRISDWSSDVCSSDLSLTGHLVLSTVHTNDAVGAITRLKDLKVEPFLLASTLRAVLAQRLVRKLCDNCREPVQADNGIAAILGLDIGTVIWRPKGCETCGGTGFTDRKSAVSGSSVYVRVDLGGRRNIKKKQKIKRNE